MKAYEYSNGQVRLESQKKMANMNQQSILWGCYEEITGHPYPYEVREATKEEVKNLEKQDTELKNELENY